MTLCFSGDRQAFSLQCSMDGEGWQACGGEIFEARNGETHAALNRVRARYVRIAFAESAALSQVRIYGQ